MSAVWILARLTVTEAIRRRMIYGVLLFGILILALSLLLVWVRADMEHSVATGTQSRLWLATQFPLRRSVITTLSLGTLRASSSLFALLISLNVLSADIESGAIALLTTRPISSSSLYLGRWLGMVILSCGATIAWGFALFASLSIQSHQALIPILCAGILSAGYPLLIGTVGLTSSIFFARLPAASVTLALALTGWADGILNSLSDLYGLSWLHWGAIGAGLVMPQGIVAHAVQRAVDEITYTALSFSTLAVSPEPIRHWGRAHGLPAAGLETIQIAFYVGLVAATGIYGLRTRVYQSRNG